jgi:DNA-directed RNA polymerase subunit RPC12/RpoP
LALRRTLCTQCDGPLDVLEEAKSVVCRHCGGRVVVEALEVGEYVAVRRFATANRMHLKKKAKVYAAVRADDLAIDGFLQGEAVSLTSIRVSKSAQVSGTLRALRISIEPGATLVGDVRVGPDQVPEIDNLRSETESPARRAGG